MAINLKSVFTSGLAAGMVMGLSAAAMVPVAGGLMEEALKARNVPPMGVLAIFFFAFVSLATGIVLVWLYAAVRPRFGPGPRTAIGVSAVVWFIGNFLPNAANVAYGFMPVGLTALGIAWGFAEMAIAGLVGARLYKEE